jgi:DHA2 family multidrug resistance protein-like MFS transporter
MALGVLTLTVVLIAVDSTVLALAVPSMANDLAPTSTQLLWIGDVYSFALAGLLVTMGNLADRIGRKRLLIIGSIGFGCASALAAFASTPELLIAARALLGVSGATIMPSTLSIIRNMFDNPLQRTRAIAVWSAGATGGAAAGPIVGGALLENFWWGSVFLINIPIVLIVVVAGSWLLIESRNPNAAQLDLLSAVLSLTAIVPLIFVIKTVIDRGFTTSVAIAFFVGVASLLFFVRRQKRSSYPMIDVELFKLPAFSGAVIANTISIFAFSGVLYFFSQYLQFVRGLSPLEAGLAQLPAALAAIVVVSAVSWTLVRLGRGRAIGMGLFMGVVGLFGLAFALHGGNLVALASVLALVGLGAGLSITLATDAVVASAPKERAGAASSISETAYELGIALGIAVLGSVLTVLYRSRLDLPEGISEASREASMDSLASAAQMVPVDSSSDAEGLFVLAQEAFTSGLQSTAAIAAILMAISGIVAWKFIPSGKGSVDLKAKGRLGEKH